MQAQQIFFPKAGEVAFETIDLPELGAHQVLVEMISSVISPGTELAWLHAQPNTPKKFPMRIAYCSCSRVIRVGDDVTALKEGQIVAHQSLHASALVLEADRCLPVPEGVRPEEAAASPLIAIALQGIRKSQVTIGESVAVFGLGPIGNLAGQLARICGAIRVVGIDPDPWRCDLALECGFDEARTELLPAGQPNRDEEGYEVVIEASGIPAAVKNAVQAASQFGRVVLLGSTRGSVEEIDVYTLIHKKGLTIIGAHNARRPAVDNMFTVKTMQTDRSISLSLLVQGRIKVLPLISDQVPATEAPEAYQRLWARRENLATIALDWTNRPEDVQAVSEGKDNT